MERIGIDERLLEYKQKSPALYLDGRYFNLVVGKHPYVVTKPLIINIADGKPLSSNLTDIYLNPTQDVILLRIIIQVVNNDGSILSRHSNLLIIDNNPRDRTISKFEPLDNNVYSEYINAYLKNEFLGMMPHHRYVELNYHPQPARNMGLCIAYVLKFAYYYLLNQPIVFEGEDDILRFAMYVEQLYKRRLNRLKSRPDIEYGNRAVAGGALFGGLTGGLIGGAVAGPVGAVAGFGLGALSGAAIGSAASKR